MRGRCIVQGLGNKAILPSAGHGVRADGLGFDGFETTAATPVPNQVFDVLLPLLGESELKVLLYIARQTLGYDRPEAPISLDSFHGDSTTPTEHLEKACGVMDRALLIAALRSLLEKGLISARNGPPGVDGNPIVMYSLRLKTDWLESGPGAPAVGPSATQRVTRYCVKSQGRAPGEATEADRKENVTRVVRPLIEFGLSSEAARHLGSRFPAQYILEKLSQVKAMAEAGSPLVSRNPQGYLRRAIEEDYTSPGKFSGAETTEATPERIVPGHSKEPGDLLTRLQGAGGEPAEDLGRVWQGALGFLQSHVSRANFQVWLEETVLLDLDEARALVGSPTVHERDWLETRMGSLVKRALAEVLGREVEVAFAVLDSGGDSDET